MVVAATATKELSEQGTWWCYLCSQDQGAGQPWSPNSSPSPSFPLSLTLQEHGGLTDRESTGQHNPSQTTESQHKSLVP